MVSGELPIDGARLDKVLVHHQVAQPERREVLIGAAEQDVGEEGEGHSAQHGHVEQLHGHEDQPHEDDKAPYFAASGER